MSKQKNRQFYRRLFKSKKPHQSLADLARENGIDPRRLYSYRSYLKSCAEGFENESNEQPDPLPAFLPVVLKSQAQTQAPRLHVSSFDLVIDGLGTLTIPMDFEESALRPLLILVRSIPC
jgi:hypothetical protein